MANKGFTMLEAMIAIFILVMGVTGVYSLFFNIITSTTLATDKLIASYLSQEGLEIIRNLRDTNWLNAQDFDNGFNCASPVGCEADFRTGTDEEIIGLQSYTASFLNLDNDGMYGYTTGTPTKFKRIITIDNEDTTGGISDFAVHVVVTVYWGDHEFSAEEYLYDWY